MAVSKASASESAPVPLAIARSMLSLGMLASRAFWIASDSAGLPAGSPPPSRAATWIARESLVNALPFLASTSFFLCLIEAHFEWPDMGPESTRGYLRGLYEEPAVSLQLLAVHRDRAALAQVADHVPVDRRVVAAAGLGIAHADREVHGAADLLVEQDLLGAGGDAVVRADPELAEALGAVIGVEHLVQEGLAALGRGVHDLASIEAQLDPRHLAAAVGGRERVADLPLHRVLHRTREELPVGHVVLAHAGYPLASGDVQADVRPRALHVHLLPAVDPVRQAPDLIGLPPPGAHRLLIGGQAGGVVEVLVVAQRQARLARVRVRRKQRQRPAVLARGGALHRGLHQRLAGLLGAGLAPRVHLRQLAGVELGHDRDSHVGALRRPGGCRRDPVELLVAGVLEEAGRPARGRQLHHREPARLQHLLVHREHQRLRGRAGLDHADVALRDVRRIAHQDGRQRLDARVPHPSPPPFARSTSQRCRLSSSLSSGWNATAVTLPCLTATGWPPTSASTSTPSPASSTHGARMNTARRVCPSSSRSASKLATWRPKALRRALTSSSPRCSRSSMISPAQVPSTGRPASASSRSGPASPSRSMPSVMVVDSPPGITRPSRPSRSAAVRTSRASAPSRPSRPAWASKSPCMASTPIVGRLTSRGAAAGSRRPRGWRSRSRPSARPARGRRRPRAAGPGSAWWPPRSPWPAARGSTT